MSVAAMLRFVAVMQLHRSGMHLKILFRAKRQGLSIAWLGDIPSCCKEGLLAGSTWLIRRGRAAYNTRLVFQ